MKLLTHMRGSDSNPLRDDFEFDDGNFYRREHPREGWPTGPIRWLVSVDYSIYRHAPIGNPTLVRDLETAYQQWASPANPERQTYKSVAAPDARPAANSATH